jgi:hypothetical protein
LTCALKIRSAQGSRLAWLALLGLSPVAQPARAHDAPEARFLVWSEDPGATPLVVSNRGLVFPDPGTGAGPFSLRCSEAYAGPEETTPLLAWGTREAGVALGLPEELVLSEHSGCDTTRLLDLASLGEKLDAIAQWPSAPERLIAARVLHHELGEHGTEQTSIWSSTDSGFSWSRVHELATGVRISALVPSPVDPARVIACGRRVRLEPFELEHVWMRSDDGGHEWQEIPQDRERTLLGMHPRQADVMLAYEAEAEGPARIVRSEDGAVSFSEVRGVPGAQVFAAQDQGTTLWLGSREAGLWRSLDHGVSFARVHPDLQTVECLAVHTDALWLCATDALGRSGVWRLVNGASTPELVVDFRRVAGPTVCSQEAAEVCRLPWLHWQDEIGAAADAGPAGSVGQPVTPRDMEGWPLYPELGAQDGGPQDGGVSRARSAGSCAVAQPHARRTASWLLVLLTVALCFRRLRRNARASPRQASLALACVAQCTSEHAHHTRDWRERPFST